MFNIPNDEEFFEVRVGYNLPWNHPVEGYFVKFLGDYKSYCLSTRILHRYDGALEVSSGNYTSRNGKYLLSFDNFETRGARVMKNISDNSDGLFDFVANDHQVGPGWQWSSLKITTFGFLVLYNETTGVGSIFF